MQSDWANVFWRQSVPPAFQPRVKVKKEKSGIKKKPFSISIFFISSSDY